MSTKIRLAFFIVFFVFAGACSSTPKKGENVLEKEPITAASKEAQARFDAAVGLLEQGQYDEASEALRLLQADYPDDPIAQVAELYIARATLRDWQPERVNPALSVFSGLSRSETVDPRIRYAALVYEGAALMVAGKTDAARKALADYPGAQISPAVLERDRADIWTLLIDTHLANGRLVRALEASGAAWSDDSLVTDRLALRSYARQRAFETAARLDQESLEETLAETGFPLSRAAIGWHLTRQTPTEELSDDLLNRLASDLVLINERGMAEELRAALEERQPTGPLRIGVVLPLSGAHRGVGERALRGAMIAANAFDETPSPATVVVVDANQSDDEIFAKLAAAGVVGFIGPLDVEKARGLANLATKKGIPMLALTTKMPTLDEVDSDGQAWVFRNFVDAEAEARAVARAAFDTNGDRRVAILHPDIGYGRRMADSFTTAFERLGGEVVGRVEYQRKSSDYGRVATRIAKINPDAVFIADAAPKIAEMTSFLAAANVWGIAHDQKRSKGSKRIEVHYLGTSLWQHEMLVKQASSYAQGALIPVWTSPTFRDERSARFTARYDEAYRESAGDLEAFVYDSVGLLIDAARLRGARSPDTVRQLLLAEPFEGATGTVRFAATGEAKRSVRFITISETEGFMALDLEVAPAPAKPVDPAL